MYIEVIIESLEAYRWGGLLRGTVTRKLVLYNEMLCYVEKQSLPDFLTLEQVKACFLHLTDKSHVTIVIYMSRQTKCR